MWLQLVRENEQNPWRFGSIRSKIRLCGWGVFALTHHLPHPFSNNPYNFGNASVVQNWQDIFYSVTFRMVYSLFRNVASTGYGTRTAFVCAYQGHGVSLYLLHRALSLPSIGAPCNHGWSVIGLALWDDKMNVFTLCDNENTETIPRGWADILWLMPFKRLCDHSTQLFILSSCAVSRNWFFSRTCVRRWSQRYKN